MIRLEQGSILDFEGDAIVNPANSFLRHGGGLAGVIARAAKDYGKTHVPVTQPHGLHTINEEAEIRALGGEWDIEQDDHPLIPTGKAGITSAGALPYRAIIHAVGPIWGGGDVYEDALLAKAHENAYRIASGRHYESIAFPAISAGVFGYPVRPTPRPHSAGALAGVLNEGAAHIAVRTIRECQQAYNDLDVTFYLFEPEHYNAYQDALEGVS